MEWTQGAHVTDDELLYAATLEAVLPWAMFCGDTFPSNIATAARRSIALDIVRHLWGALPGDPTGPARSFLPVDTAAVPWLDGMIALQGIRHRAPSVRR